MPLLHQGVATSGTAKAQLLLIRARMKPHLFPVLIAICGLLPHAKAEMIVFDFTGYITGITAGPTGFPYDDAVFAVGDPFAGSFSYVPSSLIDRDASPSRAFFFNNLAIASLSFSYAGHSYGVGQNVDFSDLWSLTLVNSEPGQGSDSVSFNMEENGPITHRFTIIDSTGTALSSDALPTSWDVTAWDSGTATRDLGPYNPSRVTFSISTGVPESSSTGLLLCLGLAGILGATTIRRARLISFKRALIGSSKCASTH
jgi:hypothetical protein